MKSLFTLLLSLAINAAVSAQSGGFAFHPMTADGALSISTQSHFLYWENPDSVYFNEVYFGTDSSLVANLDPSALLISGLPSTVYDSVQIAGTLPNNTKYYWCVAEWYLIDGNVARGFNIPVWYFYTVPYVGYDAYSFDNDLQGWEAIGPEGMNNWYWASTSHTPNQPGEMVFSGSPSFTGTSFIMSPVLTEPAGFELAVDFWYYPGF